MTLCTSSHDDHKPYRCILWGGHAWGNVGDELNLAVAIEDMRHRYGKSVAVLTRSPGYTRQLFPDCPVIPYEPIRQPTREGTPPSWYRVEAQLSGTAWAKHFETCERLYLVGGGYLSDLFMLDWAILPVLVARYYGATIATAPIGLGPYRSVESAKRVAEAFDGAGLVVRDDASAEYCREYGLAAEQKPDDGFRLSEILQPLPPGRSDASAPWRIGVNVFDQYGSARHGESRAWWKSVLKLLPDDEEIIEGFCFHSDLFADFAVTTECVEGAGLDPVVVRPPDLDFRVACAGLATFDVILSSRFHAIVVGNALGKQTFGVCDGDYYLHKMQAATQGFIQSTLVQQFACEPQATARQILHARHSIARELTAA